MQIHSTQVNSAKWSTATIFFLGELKETMEI